MEIIINDKTNLNAQKAISSLSEDTTGSNDQVSGIDNNVRSEQDLHCLRYSQNSLEIAMTTTLGMHQFQSPTG